MTTPTTNETVICIRCGHRWTVDLAKAARPTQLIYKDPNKPRIEVFRLVCPNCHQVNMHEVTYEERRDA
ncbi:MAG: hypothetical protein OHK0022_53150 [Roseiflexaceae bacterium]